MNDLVERLLKHATLITDPILYAEDRDVAGSIREAAACIQALETSLAEAEGRVIAEVVKWLDGPLRNPNGSLCRTPRAIKLAIQRGDYRATALETGEWNNNRQPLDKNSDTIERLTQALHDAINAPKGVVPKSADQFYNPRKYYR